MKDRIRKIQTQSVVLGMIVEGELSKNDLTELIEKLDPVSRSLGFSTEFTDELITLCLVELTRVGINSHAVITALNQIIDKL
jgi:hypothetical protein